MPQKRIKEMQELLEKVEKNNKKFAKFIKEFKTIEKEYKQLLDYYETQWIEDYENKEIKDSGKLLNQDSVWNELQEHYYKKIILLKSITKNL